MSESDTTKHIKIWKTTKDSNAGMMITEKAAYMIGSRNNFIVASDSGISISGKNVSINTTSENVREGGMFVKMNDLVQMVPTTLVTPMPSHIPWPPLGLVTSVMEDLPFFFALLS